jgi:hypothetical protein
MENIFQTKIVIYSCVNWAFFGMSGPDPRVPKKIQFTQERVEYVFLFDEPLKGSKSLKIFKINLTFHFDKFHIGVNSQILTVSNKKINYVLQK